MSNVQLTAEQAEKYMEENPGAALIDREGNCWVSPPPETITEKHLFWGKGYFFNGVSGSVFAPFTLPPEATASPELHINSSPETPTLRDQFAMAALTGFLIENLHFHVCDEAIAKDVRRIYKYADAMIKAREGNLMTDKFYIGQVFNNPIEVGTLLVDFMKLGPWYRDNIWYKAKAGVDWSGVPFLEEYPITVLKLPEEFLGDGN